MGNGASTDQGRSTPYGIRDVRPAVESEQYDWSELARAPITKQPNSLSSTDPNSYITLISYRHRGHDTAYFVAALQVLLQL